MMTEDKDLNRKLKKSNDQKFCEEFRSEFIKDMQAALPRHRMMNSDYLQYKGILHLNSVYGADYIKSIGLQVNVPRTFMTVEAIRPHIIDRKLDIEAEGVNKKAYPYTSKARDILLGEWKRSKAKYAKADAETDALIFGTGYLLSKYLDDTIETDVFDGHDEDGKPKTTKGTLVRYQGMKGVWLNPYMVFRDRNATTNEPGNSGSWGHCYVYSIWDFDVWQEYCKANDFDTKDMEKGGHLQEFDEVRRRIDSFYTFAGNRSRDDQGQVVTDTLGQVEKADWANSIMVVERFEEQSYSVCSGANWTLNYKGINPNPDKTIPIHVFRDYQIPGEFEGYGEPWVMRWQQYQENKVQNLSYLQVLMSTVQRYGIVKEMLDDPTSVSMENPFRPIYLKYRAGAKINDAIQALDQGKGTQYPKDYLAEIKSTGQGATGISDFYIGANKAVTDTATEAEKLANATLARIQRKIQEMEERDLVPMLEHWLACIPHYYSDELDLLVTDDENYYTKFIPYTRKFNTNIKVVSMYATQEGVHGDNIQTVEDVFLAAGYKDVVFVSDIINRFGIVIKTASAMADRQATLQEFRELLKMFAEINNGLITTGQPPKFDLALLGEELLRQYPDIIESPEDYILQMPEPALSPPPETIAQPAVI